MRPFGPPILMLALSACTVHDRVELQRDRALKFTETSVPVLVLATADDSELDKRLLGLRGKSASQRRDEIRDLLSRCGDYQHLLSGVDQKSLTVEIQDDQTIFAVEIPRRGPAKQVLWVVADLQGDAAADHCRRIADSTHTVHRLRVRPDGLREVSDRGER